MATKKKSWLDIKEQMHRLLVRDMDVSGRRGTPRQDKIREIANRYYSNIQKTRGKVHYGTYPNGKTYSNTLVVGHKKYSRSAYMAGNKG